jgi:hypothetical protein
MEHKAVDSKLIYRIVIKFQDAFYVSKEDHRLFPNKQPGQWMDTNNLMPGLSFHRLFPSVSPQRIINLVRLAKARDINYHPPNFLNYYALDFSTKTTAQHASEKLMTNEAIEKIYLETNPVYSPSAPNINSSLAIPQSHLDPAPTGIDAKYAWRHKGGDGGSNIKFIAVEQGWITDHEYVPVKTLPCSGLNHPSSRNHGTAVLGIIHMQHKNMARSGITPKAKGHVISQWQPGGNFNMADAILAAINHLDYGDVLLIESQAYDPGTKKTMPVEIYDVNFQLIQLATALGITVIEPAGNGNNISGHDLDLFTNVDGCSVLNRSSAQFRYSGAIVVAAAGSSAPHKKMGYTNFGSRIDCYAWGENVVTAGGFPSLCENVTNSYTTTFSGTSSASAIITGVAIALQGIAEANLHCRLSPSQVRAFLSNEAYGTASANGKATDKIGVMPDLKKIIRDLLKLHLAEKSTALEKSKAPSN